MTRKALIPRWPNMVGFNHIVGIFAVVAAVLYNSWPLGYVLDPVVERHALASELQAPHRPYNWVFILTDVAAGLIVAGIGAYQLKRFHFRHGRLIAACIIVFGLLVAMAAIVPLRCDPTIAACGPLIHSPMIVLHGFASVGSVIMLFAALVISLQAARQKGTLSFTLATVILLLACWVLFAFGAVIEYVFRIKGNGLQDYFISICSLSMAVVVVLNERVMRTAIAVEVPSRKD